MYKIDYDSFKMCALEYIFAFLLISFFCLLIVVDWCDSRVSLFVVFCMKMFFPLNIFIYFNVNSGGNRLFCKMFLHFELYWIVQLKSILFRSYSLGYPCVPVTVSGMRCNITKLIFSFLELMKLLSTADISIDEVAIYHWY